MNLSEADVLLMQWVIWSFDDTRTGYAIGSWQKDWRTTDWEGGGDWVEVLSEVERRLGAGDEKTMLVVDSALSQLGRTDAHNAHVLRARYRLGHNFTADKLDHALRQFCAVYDELTDTDAAIRVIPVERIRSL